MPSEAITANASATCLVAPRLPSRPPARPVDQGNWDKSTRWISGVSVTPTLGGRREEEGRRMDMTYMSNGKSTHVYPF
jgi:hypothetical protein